MFPVQEFVKSYRPEYKPLQTFLISLQTFTNWCPAPNRLILYHMNQI